MSNARLFLQGQYVGDVAVQGSDTSWGFGEFTPNDHFSTFATLFGTWSLLMHADDTEAELSEAASDELRRAEYAMDALNAELHSTHDGKTLRVGQLNIDGKLIEWKIT